MYTPASWGLLPPEIISHVYTFVDNWQAFSLINWQCYHITRLDCRIAEPLTIRALTQRKNRNLLNITARRTFCLNLNSQTVPVKILKEISRHLPHLRFLNLNLGIDLSSKKLRQLKRLKELRGLDIGQFVYQNDSLISLSSCSKPLNLDFLSHHPKLEYLNLSGWSYQQSELEKLNYVPSLKALELKHPWSSNMNDLEFLQHVPNLEALSLGFGKTSLQPDSLRALRHIPRLTYLDLNSSGLRGSDLKYLQLTPNLRTLSIGSTRKKGNLILESHLGHLRHASKLIKLDLSQSRCSNLALEYFSYLPGMEELSLLGCRNITDRGLDCLKHASRLQTLTLGPFSWNSQSEVNIAHQRASETLITDHGVEKLQALRDLRCLKFVFCSGITQRSCELLKGNENLRILKFYHCALIGESSLRHLQKLKNLSELVIHQCQFIEEDKIRTLKEKLPNTKITYISPEDFLTFTTKK